MQIRLLTLYNDISHEVVVEVPDGIVDPKRLDELCSVQCHVDQWGYDREGFHRDDDDRLLTQEAWDALYRPEGKTPLPAPPPPPPPLSAAARARLAAHGPVMLSATSPMAFTGLGGAASVNYTVTIAPAPGPQFSAPMFVAPVFVASPDSSPCTPDMPSFCGVINP